MQDAAGTDDARAGREPRRTASRRAALSDTALIHAGLARIIEGEVLPRLALAHRENWRHAVPTTRPPTPERVAAFAHALMNGDPDDGQFRRLLDEGLPLDILLLDLLAPAARHLGHLWEEDEADFLDVTVGLGRLHGLARALCARLEKADTPEDRRCVLLMPCPGETHLFSLALVASFFREGGWGVVLTDGAVGEPTALVRAERFELIGISLSCDVHLPAMAGLVADLRAASRNPGVRVMVGGPPFLREPARAVAIGADATAGDGRSAVRIADALTLVGAQGDGGPGNPP